MSCYSSNVSEPLGRNNIPKNNVAEIKAAVRAIKIAKKHGTNVTQIECFVNFIQLSFYNTGYRRLVVHTDSQFMMDCLMDPVWLLTWLGNGWKKADGTPVVLKVQLRELLMAMEKMEIKLVNFLFSKIFENTLILSLFCRFTLRVTKIQETFKPMPLLTKVPNYTKKDCVGMITKILLHEKSNSVQSCGP